MITARGSAAPGPPSAFAGQRVREVPPAHVEAALRQPATRQLTVVDAGYYPAAAGHLRRRDVGARDLIVLLCVSGHGQVDIGGVSHRLGAASYAVLPAFVPHRYQSSDDVPWTIWWAHLRGAEIGDLTRLLVREGQPVAAVRSLDRAVALFDELLSLLERRPSPAQVLAASGVAWQLLTRLAADRALPGDASPFERAVRYLEARVDGTIQVGALAELVGVSASHLGALFRAATGSGPAAFHTGLKMARARTLLATTTMPVAEVARAVGYSDPLHFSRRFRQHQGLSPSAYRDRAGG
ncbi:AraC family transcriptional regulator [Streptomyces sp. DSM 44915]|uniref:AraC family transcriptional regulator n=1 Tax=Streptomyces chisholmiae TaxID=3075540 RepID=A0ABU2JUM5_9ACTN|nr:AraC family transcriptional regulator [Streptomyces sp. DSM 44915]MDT0268690.1 AraC family transcriptional regulator [Streptomyces sp. DSM 44915]